MRYLAASLLFLLLPILALASEDVPAKLLNATELMKQCPYPAEAESEGETLLSLVIDETGALSNISVKQSSGSQELDDAAVECMKKGQFQPATHDGQATASGSVAPWRWTLPSVARSCDAAVSKSSLKNGPPDPKIWPQPAYVCFCFDDSGVLQGKPTIFHSTGYRDADRMAMDVVPLKSGAYQRKAPGCHLFGVKFDTNWRPHEGFDDLVDRFDRSGLYPLNPGATYLLPDPYYRGGVQLPPK
jgi:TonB family protein